MAVSLQKGQEISLDKEIYNVVMGLGWDAGRRKGLMSIFGGNEEVDLDACCFMFNERNELADLVFFNHLRSEDGSVQHSGDNRTGAGDEDDEQIAVALDCVPAHIRTLVFTVSNYTGQDFGKVENAFCRLIDGQSGKEIARYDLSAQGSHTAQIMAKIYRHEGGWKMCAIGENSQGPTPDRILPNIAPFL